MRATRPLFLFDPGWLFVLGGLAVCAAGVLLPAQADLHALEQQLLQLQSEEARAYQRLAAHADFIDQVEHGEASIIKRLAAAQLNVVPAGDTPLLLSSVDGSPVTEWIEATVELDIRPPQPELASTLSRWASGPSRLWMFGGGIMAVFIGLMITPGTIRKAREVGVADAMLHSAAAPWRRGNLLVEPVLFQQAIADDENHGARDGHADALVWDQIVADGDDADTVDLDESELVASKRSVIEDDTSDSLAGADDDAAAEVMIEAKELEPIMPVAGAEIVGDPAGHEVIIENEAATDFIEEGLGRDEAAMLLTEQLTAGTGLLEQVERHVEQVESGAVIEDADGAPEEAIEGGETVSSDNTETVAPRSARRSKGRRNVPDVSECLADRPADPPAEVQSESAPIIEVERQADTGSEAEAQPVSMPPEDDEKYAAIPFLRYRREADARGNDATGDSDDERGPRRSRRR